MIAKYNVSVPTTFQIPSTIYQEILLRINHGSCRRHGNDGIDMYSQTY